MSNVYLVSRIPSTLWSEEMTSDFNSTEYTINATTSNGREETENNDDDRLGTVLGVVIPMIIICIVVAAVLVYMLWYRRRTPKTTARKTRNCSDNVHCANPVSNPDPVYVNVEFTKPCFYQELQQKQQDTKETSSFYEELHEQQNDCEDRQLPSENSGPMSLPVMSDDIYVNESAEGTVTGEFGLTYECEGNDDLVRKQEVEELEQTMYENGDAVGTLQEDPGMYENEDRNTANTGNSQLGVFDISYEDVDSPLPAKLLNQNGEYAPEASSIYENVRTIGY